MGSSKHTSTVPFAGAGLGVGSLVGCSLLLVPPPPTETTGDEVGRLEAGGRQAGRQAGDRRQETGERQGIEMCVRMRIKS